MWDDLKSLAASRDGTRIDALFAQDAERAETFSVRHDGMLFDYSKTLIDAEIRAALIAVAETFVDPMRIQTVGITSRGQKNRGSNF